MNSESKFLCYLDILGFQNRISEEGFKKGYNAIIQFINSWNYPDKVYLISDSILILSKEFRELVDKSFSIYDIALSHGLFIRGAVTKGEIVKLPPVKETGNKVIIPYLGEAFLRAYRLEQSINCAAICVDSGLCNELLDEEKTLIFEYNELFPKKGINELKVFLVSDMLNNWNVPQTILSRISEQSANLSSHDLSKFIDTFCLYYKAMREKHCDENNLAKYYRWWVNILQNL